MLLSFYMLLRFFVLHLVVVGWELPWSLEFKLSVEPKLLPLISTSMLIG